MAIVIVNHIYSGSTWLIYRGTACHMILTDNIMLGSMHSDPNDINQTKKSSLDRIAILQTDTKNDPILV